MVQRTVSVGLIANVNSYVANMNRAADATRKNAAAMVGSEKQLRAQGEVFTKIGTSAMAGGAIAAAGLALVVKKTAEFGSKMAELQTVLGASRADMKRLSDAALEQGRAYGYSASQVADAQIELAKAGVTVKQQLGGALKGSLALAAAGQIDVAQATSISVQAMSQFKLEAKDLPHVADLLAAGAANTTASVDSLGQALSQSGGVAHQFGISLDDTVGVLSLFDQNALKGSDGGTSFKSMLLALASPSTVAKKKIDELGISAYDANGNFVGVTKYAQILQDRLKTLTPEARNAALGIVFGSDAARAAGVFYDAGAKKLGAYIKQNQIAGYASAQAAGKLNSLSGDVQKLGAAFDTNLIKAGTGANDVLRELVQTGSGVLDTIGAIPAPVMTLATTLTAVTAGAGLLGGGFLVARVKLSQFRQELAEANLSGKKFAGTFGKGGLVLMGVTAVASGLANLSTTGTANTQQLGLAAVQIAGKWKHVDDVFRNAGAGGVLGTSNLITGANGAKAALEQLTGSPLQQMSRLSANFIDGASSALTFGVAGTHVGDVYKSNAQTFDAIGQQLAGLAKQDLPAAQASFNGLNKQLGGTRESASRALTEMTPYRDALIEIAGKAGVVATESNLVDIAQRRGAASAKVIAYQQKEAASAAKEHAAAIGVLAGAANDGTTSVKALGDAIENLDGGQLSARDAARQYEAAIDAATAAAKKNGKTLDISTEAGRDNQASLDGIAEAAKQSASAYLKMSDDSAGASKIIRAGRKAYVDAAVLMGMNRKRADELAAALFAIPKSPKITVKLDDAAAQQRIRDTRDALMKLNGAIATVYVKAVNQSKVPTSVSGALIASGRAAGGAIDGDGPKGVDSVPTILAPGEHVLTADDVDKMGGQSNVYAFRNALHMAKGGAVKKPGKPKSVLDRSRDEITAALAKQKASQPSNVIAVATAAATAADREADALTRQIVEAKKRAAARTKSVTLAEKAEERAQKAYSDIDGSKKNRAAKKAAKADLDATRNRVKLAKKQADSAEKRVDKLRDDRGDSQKKRDDALASAAQLRNDREDFVSSERRGGQEPLGYVDQLRAMSRDDNYSASQRAEFKKAANDYEKTITGLNKQSEDNSKALEESTKKLDDNKSAVDDATSAFDSLRATSDQLRGSVSSSISGKYAATSAVTPDDDTSVETGSYERDGISYRTYGKSKGGQTTVGSLDSYYSGSANDSGVFASQLQQLAARYIDKAFLAEIAGEGATQGGAIASALLSANDIDFKRINNNYAATLVNSDRAGSTVADYTYGGAIASAQANVSAATATRDAQQAIVDSQKATADQITAALTGDGNSLKNVIGKAFGLPGYATGTDSATPGLHLVGEQGPELLRLGGGERIYTASQTSAYLRGGGAPAARAQAARLQVSMPESLQLIDADGALMGRVRVEARGVARQEIATDQMQDAVLGWGGAA